MTDAVRDASQRQVAERIAAQNHLASLLSWRMPGNWQSWDIEKTRRFKQARATAAERFASSGRDIQKLRDAAQNLEAFWVVERPA
jgi:hypothetical protein